MSEVFSSAGFQGSGWLLTLLGTVCAFLTLWQVGRKNSAFRRALTNASRQDSRAELAASAATLIELAKKISSASGSSRTWSALAMNWATAAGQMDAALLAHSTSDPLNLSSADFSRWDTSTGKKLLKSINSRRGEQTSSQTSYNPARELSASLRASCDQAHSVLEHPEEDAFRLFTAAAAQVAERASFVSARINHARSQDLHDDR